jgi:RNA polymerase sigma factor (sigma-70 family)
MSPDMDARAAADEEIGVYLHAARNGDERGFTGLYNTLAGRVAGYARSRGVVDVDDVVNEVFLSVFQNLGTISGGAAPFRSWLFSIAWNKSVDWHRSATRRPTPVDPQSPTALSTQPSTDTLEQLNISNFADERTRDLLATLTTDQRDVLLLRIVAELSIDETAAALRKPAGAIKSLQHRALESLRKTMTPPVSSDGPPPTTAVR